MELDIFEKHLLLQCSKPHYKLDVSLKRLLSSTFYLVSKWYGMGTRLQPTGPIHCSKWQKIAIALPQHFPTKNPAGVSVCLSAVYLVPIAKA